MTRSTVIVICIVAMLGGAVAYVASDRASDTKDPGNAATTNASPSPTTQDSGTADNAVSASATQESPDRSSETPDLGASSEYERMDYERMKDELMWALDARRDEECIREDSYRVDPDTGKDVLVVSSTCTKTRPEHPYRAFPTDVLESMAYSDPVAAVVLGHRMWANNDNVHKTVDMMIRATALSDGQWEHLNWFTNQRFSGLSRNGVPDVQSIHARYVLETVMDHFRENGPRRESWYERARETYVIPDHEITRLEDTADRYLARIRQIQRDVLGLTDMEVDEHEQQEQNHP